MKYFITTLFAVLIIVTPVFALQDIYRVELRVDKNDSVELIDVYKDFSREVTNDSEIDRSADNVLRADLIGEDGKILSSTHFQVNFFIFDVPTEFNEIPVQLDLPFHNDGKLLKVYKGNQEKLSFELKTNLCNNNKACDNMENVYSCPSDCDVYSKDRVCAGVSYDGGCDPDCPSTIDVDCKVNKTQTSGNLTTKEQPKPLDNSWLYILVIVVIIVIAVIIVGLKKHY